MKERNSKGGKEEIRSERPQVKKGWRRKLDEEGKKKGKTERK